MEISKRVNMKIIIKSIIVLMLFTNCKTQSDTHKLTQIKTFDIEIFEKNKNQLNEYEFVTKDGTIIKQSDDGYEFYETVKHPDSYFIIINRYYKNGDLKLTGELFENNFQKGVWKEYDEQGNLTSETDFDKTYDFAWEDVLSFIEKRKIQMDAYGFEITRNWGFDSSESKKESLRPFWAITYNKSEIDMVLGVIILDGITGDIIKEYDEPYPSEE